VSFLNVDIYAILQAYIPVELTTTWQFTSAYKFNFKITSLLFLISYTMGLQFCWNRWTTSLSIYLQEHWQITLNPCKIFIRNPWK